MPRKFLGNVKFLFYAVFKSLKEFSGKFQFLFLKLLEWSPSQIICSKPSSAENTSQVEGSNSEVVVWASSLLSCVGVSQERSSAFHEFLRWRQQCWGSSWLCRETGTHQLHTLPWSRMGWHFVPTAAIPELSASLFLLVIGPIQDIILAPSFHWSQGTRIYKNMNAEKRDLHERDSLKMNPNLTNNWLCDLEGNYPLWASISSTIKAILKKKKPALHVHQKVSHNVCEKGNTIRAIIWHSV